MASKLGILKALLDIAPGGDDEPIAFADRPNVRAFADLQDARVAAAASRRTCRRTGR